MVAVGVIVVVSHAARNASTNKPTISFMIKIEMSGRLLSLPLYQHIWQGPASGGCHGTPLLALQVPWLDGVSPYQCENFIGRATLCGADDKRDVCSYKKRSMIGPSFL